MKKDINDLSSDVYKVLDSGLEHEPDTALAADYAMRISGEMAKSTLKRDKGRTKGKLWASDLGKPCMRQHWYNFNMPEAGDPLMGHTKFKFLYGNILEEAILYLAEEAGHDVWGQQERIEWDVPNTTWAVSGRIDGVVDDTLIDVKSTSSFGYKKYSTEGINHGNDSFGYLYQLGFYKEFNDWDFPPDDAGFLWIDKQNGHVKYTQCATPNASELEQRARDIIDAVETDTVSTVNRGYAPEPYGKSGNECLPMPCSYCAFKKECWKDSNGNAGLRTFAYGHKPVHFTKIVREPRVQEIT